jgi:hypothetical protein
MTQSVIEMTVSQQESYSSLCVPASGRGQNRRGFLP